ncbi:MAG: hypothetical protein QXT39_06575, partial [Conexivisphaerales archaeon]
MHKLVDWDSSGVNLEPFLVRNSVPQHQSFDSYSQACLSICIYNLATFFASEQGIDASIMSIPDSTIAGTPFAC